MERQAVRAQTRDEQQRLPMAPTVPHHVPDIVPRDPEQHQNVNLPPNWI